MDYYYHDDDDNNDDDDDDDYNSASNWDHKYTQLFVLGHYFMYCL